MGVHILNTAPDWGEVWSATNSCSFPLVNLWLRMKGIQPWTRIFFSGLLVLKTCIFQEFLKCIVVIVVVIVVVAANNRTA